MLDIPSAAYLPSSLSRQARSDSCTTNATDATDDSAISSRLAGSHYTLDYLNGETAAALDPQLYLPQIDLQVIQPAPPAATPPRGRWKRWIEAIQGHGRAPVAEPPAAVVATGESGPYPWRPRQVALQHYGELVDAIDTAPAEDLGRIARALARKLRRQVQPLPPRQHGPLDVLRSLLANAWRSDIDAGRLNITDMLEAIAYSTRVPPHVMAQLRPHLAPALAALTSGMHALAVPICREKEPDDYAGTLVRSVCIADVEAGARRLGRTAHGEYATPGQLAEALHECLCRTRSPVRERDGNVVGQVGPTIQALIDDRIFSVRMAGEMAVAARRLDDYIGMLAGLDMPSPDSPLPGMHLARQAVRVNLMGGLLRCSLNPALLNQRLKQADMVGLIDLPYLQTLADLGIRSEAMELVREALAPMLDMGLISPMQRNELLRQLKRHLRLMPRPLPQAAFTG